MKGQSGPRVWTLEGEEELRIEVAKSATFSLLLKEGNAEIFGVELPENAEVNFTGVKLAVFTWYGCVLETKGDAQVAYQSHETPMNYFVNTHVQLEGMREAALAKFEPSRGVNPVGPRVLVCGPPDSGKSSICSILSSYAVRLARKPTYVNLDVGAGHITVPGTLSAAALDSSVMSVEQGFSLAAPLVFWYGHTAADETPDLYKQLVTKLAECVDSRLANDREAAAAGLIINTPGWVNSKGLELLKHAVDVVRADVILVVDDDKLLAEIQGHVQESTKEVGRSPVTVLKVPKSGGVVRRLPQDLRQERNESMRQYFYGSRNPEWLGAGAALTPSVLELRFEEVVLCRVGGEKLSDGLLPVGQVAMLGPLQVTRIQPTAALTHSILAVCHPLLRADGTVLGQTGEEDELGHELVDSNVAGFIFITDVDMERKRLVMLSPCPGSLPSKYLLWGDIKWVE